MQTFWMEDCLIRCVLAYMVPKLCKTNSNFCIQIEYEDSEISSLYKSHPINSDIIIP